MKRIPLDMSFLPHVPFGCSFKVIVLLTAVIIPEQSLNKFKLDQEELEYHQPA